VFTEKERGRRRAREKEGEKETGKRKE